MRANAVKDFDSQKQGEAAVRGSPDPALDPTEGLPEQGFTPMHGDLRSGCRRGQETRAERFIQRY